VGGQEPPDRVEGGAKVVWRAPLQKAAQPSHPVRAIVRAKQLGHKLDRCVLRARGCWCLPDCQLLLQPSDPATCPSNQVTRRAFEGRRCGC
jgi:hypothetical protein